LQAVAPLRLTAQVRSAPATVDLDVRAFAEEKLDSLIAINYGTPDYRYRDALGALDPTFEESRWIPASS
jgi:hypothetical protein